jgi:hypothetical protein
MQRASAMRAYAEHRASVLDSAVGVVRFLLFLPTAAVAIVIGLAWVMVFLVAVALIPRPRDLDPADLYEDDDAP